MQLQASQVEVDGVPEPEPFPVPESAGSAIEALRLGVHRPSTGVGELSRTPDVLCVDFRQAPAEQLRLVAAERGVVLGPGLGNAIHRLLGRVAAERALTQCHILSIRGRDYHYRLSPSVA